MIIKYRTLLTLIIVFTSYTSLSAQAKKASLTGTWLFTNYEYLSENKDSSKLNEESKGIVLNFLEGDKFTTSKIINNKKIVLGTGDYKLSVDNKYLYQNEQKAEIILLSAEKLAFKVGDDLILHFNRKK